MIFSPVANFGNHPISEEGENNSVNGVAYLSKNTAIFPTRKESHLIKNK